MFLTALFTIARTGNNLNIHQWMNGFKKKKRGYRHTMEYYLSIKKKETLSFVTAWMNLEDIMISETSQSQRHRYCMILLI